MVDATYPPTFILHGTADSAVPVEQSRAFEAKCKQVGIPIDARYCEGGEHCFENKIEVVIRTRAEADMLVPRPARVGRLTSSLAWEFVDNMSGHERSRRIPIPVRQHTFV